MTVESASFISQLDTSLPASGDAKSEGDNHLRTIKAAVKGSFPNLGASAVTTTTAELNHVAGVTSGIQSQLNAEIAARAAAVTAEANARIASDAIMLQADAVWVSGTNYAIGDLRYSPIDFQTYRRKTAGAGTTDPSLDVTNWAAMQVVVQDYQEFLTSGTWTKPASATFVYVEAIGGGAGGNLNLGGGGGGFVAKLLNATALGATVTVSIGSGGLGRSIGDGLINAGGDSSFSSAIAKGGFGGDSFTGLATGVIGGMSGGGEYGCTSPNNSRLPSAGGYSSGAGGTTGNTGGSCVMGGAGGGGLGSVAGYGGMSQNGGDGGNANASGVGGVGIAPGGGGGAGSTSGGSGGAGRVRVWAW